MPKHPAFLMCLLSFSLWAGAQVPVITGFIPATGPAGTTVTISGSGFDPVADSNFVYFGTMKAKVLSATSSQLTVMALAGSTGGPITVTSHHLMTRTQSAFTISFDNGRAMWPGMFRSIGTIPAANAALAVTGDMDGDGKPDIVSEGSGAFSVALNRSNPGIVSTLTAPGFATSTPAGNISVGDLDGDGRVDVALSNPGGGISSITTYHNLPNIIVHDTNTISSIAFDQPYTQQTGPNLYVTPQRSTIADVNGDGRPELIVANGGSSVAVIRNASTPGNIQFPQRNQFAVNGNAESIAVADLDSDGKPDIIVSINGQPGILILLRNTGFGPAITFAAPLEIITGMGAVDFAVFDMDADGKPDIAVSNFGAPQGSVSLLQNTSQQGSISFTILPDLAFDGLHGHRIGIGDIDGDGKMDIVEGNDASVAVYKNNSTPGAIAFAPGVFCLTGALNPLVADFDGDGLVDIAIPAADGNTLAIFQNIIRLPASALVIPNGPSGVGPLASSTLTIDPSVQTYNGYPYVQRHYDIVPAANASTATAAITLYFTQSEFDNYNQFPGHGADLPTGPTDLAGKANLKIHQYHGFSSSGLPGSYSGSDVIIDPGDNKIVWNSTGAWWEVTFDVTGFSGFFVSTVNLALPLHLLQFTAAWQNNAVQLHWLTTAETGTKQFVVERSRDGASFSSIGVVAAQSTTGNHSYQFTDMNVAGNKSFYRLKMQDIDGHFTYSKIIVVTTGNSVTGLTVYPNPSASHASVVFSTVASIQYGVTVTDMNGKILQRFTGVSVPGKNTFSLNTSGYSNGNYLITLSDSENGRRSLQFNKR